MNVSAFTLILPRIETFFLEEWIEHHSRLGIDEIYIYENGMASTDNSYESGKHEWIDSEEKLNKAVWAKKPLADYFLDYSDEQIYDELHKIVGKYSNVHLLEWHQPFRNENGTHSAQLDGWRHCAENHISDWWIHIDVDEYINPLIHEDIKHFLQDNRNVPYSAFWVQQRVFNERVRNKKVREIVNWGYDLELTKVIVKSDIEKYRVHSATPSDGKIKQVPRDEMIIHHYRGRPKHQGGVNHRKDEFLKSNFDKIDTSLLRFID